MLEIKPIQSKENQSALCALAGIEYMPEAFAYSAYDGNKFLGVAQFIIEDNGTATIRNLAPAKETDDFEAMFIMGRAVLNFLDLCHIKQASIDKDACEERLAIAIGFHRASDTGYAPLSLVGMFDSKCTH